MNILEVIKVLNKNPNARFSFKDYRHSDVKLFMSGGNLKITNNMGTSNYVIKPDIALQDYWEEDCEYVTFCIALNALLSGSKIYRKGWNTYLKFVDGKIEHFTFTEQDTKSNDWIVES